MSFKISVEDRVATYPGRVQLTPVAGEANVYDMKRADMPIVEGTPINKALFDSKADMLASDVTVYVSKSGNDMTGDGSITAPFVTIQKAIDVLPKNLGGHTATIDIEEGAYEEGLVIDSFSSGKLIIGITNRFLLVRKIEISSSSLVELNVSHITKSANFEGRLLYIKDGSNVVMANRALTLDSLTDGAEALRVENCSKLSCNLDHTLTVSNCFNAAVVAAFGSQISLMAVAGANNSMGLYAMVGGIISFETSTLDGGWGDHANAGGMLVTGSGVYTLSPSEIE